jgi:hypothetical protein
MNLQEFRSSVDLDQPPHGLPSTLLAMWFAAKGDWDQAHGLSQDIKSADGDWIHAYLHRVEGDNQNAAYWYRRADRPVSSLSLDDEWAEIVEAMIIAGRVTI